MLPGKKYKPEDFLWVAWNRKWFIIVPAVVLGLGTFVFTWFLPDRYVSRTTILVIPQRVPSDFVRSTVTASVAERLTVITQQIMSRTRLEQIIQEFNLYPEERQTMIMEDVVELMRTRDIKVDVATPRRGEDASYFTVGFESPRARLAMQVADRLASMFVQENLQDRALLADSTNQFLQAQLEDARRRLIEHDQKVEAFKQRNFGQLPTQVQSNLQMMQVTQSQLQSNSELMARERDRLAVLDEMIADAASSLDQPLGLPVEPAGGDVAATSTAGTPAQQLVAARATLRGLLQRLRPGHPDVVATERLIAQLEARVAQEPAPAGGGAAPAVAAASPAAADRLTKLRLEAEDLRKSLAAREETARRLNASFASFTSRLEAAPKLESELTELMRDYSTIQEGYQSLLRKSEDSKIALNLERRQIGEQFKIIDGARLPERPVSPDRPRTNLMGLAGGLALGLALVALLEYKDTTLKTDDDIVSSLALPVLAVVPAMVTNADRKRRTRRRLQLGASASIGLLLLLVVAFAVWRMELLQAWVR